MIIYFLKQNCNVEQEKSKTKNKAILTLEK